MKYLVTGSAGFIGFHTASALLKRGDEVVGIDNFNDYYSTKLKYDRNSILEKNPGFRSIHADLCNDSEIRDIFESERFDKVCTLAAQAGVRYSLDHPHTYVSSNIRGFLNILEGCRHTGVKRCVYASSSSVYGGNRDLPFSVSDRVDNPVSLYAASKKANELMAHCYTHLYGFETVGLRFFTVYGPWGRPDMAMWLFTEAILNNKPIDVYNNGDMQRDFTYIDDIVKGIISSLDAEGLESYEVFNLGNHRSENLLDLIGLIENTIGKKAEKHFLPMQPGDVKATYADIDKTADKLGFLPETSIREGVPEFIKWYRDYHAI